MRTWTAALIVLSCLALWSAGSAGAKASHAGWPEIDGWLRMNKEDQSRPLSGLPNKHNELLGGHGNDTIVAGHRGDVIWGDYKPCCQPTTQVDHLYGGPGNDFIYASHGFNYIFTGGGHDIVHAHFGAGGEIHCDSPDVLVYLSHRSRRLYRLFGCRHISYATERSSRH